MAEKSPLLDAFHSKETESLFRTSVLGLDFRVFSLKNALPESDSKNGHLKKKKFRHFQKMELKKKYQVIFKWQIIVLIKRNDR